MFYDPHDQIKQFLKNLHENKDHYNQINPLFLQAGNEKQEKAEEKQEEPKVVKRIRRKKTKLLFKDIEKIVKPIGNELGIKDDKIDNCDNLQKMLEKERRKNNLDISRRATQVKKLSIQKGVGIKVANQEKRKFIDNEKDHIRKLLLKSQLETLISINAGIKK